MIQKHVVVTGLALLLAVGLAGCSPAPTASTAAVRSTVSPAHPIKPAIPSWRALARVEAGELLASVVLPADATVVTTTPAGAPNSAATSILCTPKHQATSYAVISGVSLAQAEAEVVKAAGSDSTGTGSTSSGGSVVSDFVGEKSPYDNSALTITLVASGSDVVARVDAVVAEHGATCENPGGPMIPSTSKP